MNILEEKIAKLFKANDCLYTYSGTSALYISFLHAKNLGKEKILIPNIICPQVVVSALKANLKVYFCDVNLDDYILNLKDIKKIYHKDKFDILLLAHIYGHICDENIIYFCKENNIFIIEDSAQTYKINSNCDLSILSFGHTKFLQNEHGGGCILSNNNLENLKSLNSNLPHINNEKKEYAKNYSKEFYKLQNNKKYFYNLKDILLKYTIFCKDENINYKLLKKLDLLDEICENRHKKMQIYQKYLKHDLIIHPKISKDSISWRYTFRFLGNKNKLLNLLRKNNIDCSSWYIGCDNIFSNTNISKTLENQIINLWLDESIEQEQIYKNIKIITDLINNI